MHSFEVKKAKFQLRQMLIDQGCCQLVMRDGKRQHIDDIKNGGKPAFSNASSASIEFVRLFSAERPVRQGWGATFVIINIGTLASVCLRQGSLRETAWNIAIHALM